MPIPRSCLPLLFAALPLSLTAQQLAPGQPAPPLQISKWLKGEPVAAFQAGHVYVVEFWMTWCGPCIDGMPHLSEVQKRHRGALTVIGVTNEDEHNTLADAQKMVAAKGDSMGYTVAWDDAGKTWRTWFDASGEDGIPSCFVVDKAGVIAWIGHPQWLDVVLPTVLAGKSEPAAVAAQIDAVETRMKKVFLLAAFKPEKAIAEAEALCKELPFLTEQVENGMFELMLAADDPKLAWPLGDKLLQRAIAAKDPVACNGIAWAIVDPAEERKERNTELAMKAAVKAVELTERKDASILDTLARVHATKGEWQQAVAVQKEALALVKDDEEARSQLEPALAEYEKQLKAKG
jgi:thiol-disulfide isomerase/thioredoxin